MKAERIQLYFNQLPGWAREGPIDALVGRYQFAGVHQSFDFLAKVGQIAKQGGPVPHIELRGESVRLRLEADSGGVTKEHFEQARRFHNASGVL